MLYTKEALHYAEVQVSEILESHGIPDPYVWRFNSLGQLIPENIDQPIEEIIVKDNPLGKIEYEAFLKIQNKAFTMDSGFIIWISPTHPVYYPDVSKIVVSEKKGETLLNRAITTDWDTLGSILAAKELASLSDLNPDIFRSPTDVRSNPIFIAKEKETQLSLVLKKMLDQKAIEMMRSGEDFLAKEKYIDDFRAGRRISLGQSPLSCPVNMGKQTAFKVFSGEDEYGSIQFECPHCHKTNIRQPHKLISSCQHCGSSVRCG